MVQIHWLSLNINETSFIQFPNKNSPQIDLDISYANKLISKACDTKFLGIYADSTLSWKVHSEQITQIKCSLVCSETFVSQEILQMVYYTYLPFFYELWINILGKLFTQSNNFQNTKEYEWLRNAEVKTRVEIYLRI
jgi:hypothetical protein